MTTRRNLKHRIKARRETALYNLRRRKASTDPKRLEREQNEIATLVKRTNQ